MNMIYFPAYFLWKILPGIWQKHLTTQSVARGYKIPSYTFRLISKILSSVFELLLIRQLDSRWTCSASCKRMQLVDDMMNMRQLACCSALTAPRTAPPEEKLPHLCSFFCETERQEGKKRILSFNIICAALYAVNHYFIEGCAFTMENAGKVLRLCSDPEEYEAPRSVLSNLMWHGWAKLSSFLLPACWIVAYCDKNS